MINVNGPGFAGLYAGDSVLFRLPDTRANLVSTRAVLPLLVFDTHVVVAYGPHGHVVDASNFVRLVRRGKRHIAADKERTGFYTADYVRAVDKVASNPLHAAVAALREILDSDALHAHSIAQGALDALKRCRE